MKARGLLIGVLLLIVIVGGVAWFGRGTYAQAQTGTTYVAKQTCSCLFVAGRPMDSCKTDYDPAALAQLKVAASSDAVTVSALGGLVSGRARFEPGFGCHPVK